MASFDKDIRPLFRELDVNSMRRMFDLSKYEDVKTHAEQIYHAVDAGSMPCDGRWTADQVALLRSWIDEGYPA
jgi:hypothetical protein